MAVRNTLKGLGVTGAITDLCALNNIDPPPMEHAADPLGLERSTPSNDFEFIYTPGIGGPSL